MFRMSPVKLYFAPLQSYLSRDLFMARGPVLSFLALILIVALPLPHCFAEDDDQVVYKKPVSEWLTILKSDKTEKNRRAALIALGDVGLRSRKVVPAVSAALKED